MNKSNAKKKNSSQKAPKREQRAEAVVENHFRLGHCAELYAKSLANPFSGPPEACMPVTPCIMSQKVRCFARGQLSVGTNGYGFFAASHNAANDGATTAGNVGTAAAYYSDSTYIGAAATGVPVLNPATAGVIAVNTNSPYASANFGQAPGKVQCRLVSSGIRVRYAGTKMNEGGRMLLLEDPDHFGDPNVSYPVATMLANEKAKEHKVSTEWTSLCSTGPVTPDEYDFFPDHRSPSGVSYFPLRLIIQSTAGNIFDWEIYENWEFAGSIVRGKTYSEADDLGVSVVLGAIKNHNDSQLDSRHPLIASTTSKSSGNSSPQVLGQIVQQYAAKNASGWIAGAVRKSEQIFNSAKPYLKSALHVAEAVAPLMLM